jgi:hypothetical protein
MATACEVEKLALELAKTERAIFAAHLLKPLPAVFDDVEEGLAKALQRDKALDATSTLDMAKTVADYASP